MLPPLEMKPPARRGSISKISQKTLEERLDFTRKPVHSFHEALLRLLPPTARQKTPRLIRSAPSSEVKSLGQRECHCDQRSHKRRAGSDDKVVRCICADEEGSGEDKKPSSCAANFRSSAVYCEVKLAELLKERESEPGIPDVHRTAVCWEIFNEICKLSMPFSRVLSHIKDELQHAIFSHYVVPPGTTPAFEQLPYFEIVNRLQGKNKELEEQHQKWREELQARQADILRIEEHIQVLRDQIKAAEAVSNDLQTKLNTTISLLEAAKSKVKILHGKSRVLKKDLKKARVLVLEAREIAYEKDVEKQKHEKLRAQYSQLVHELQHTQSFLESARVEASDSVPKTVYCAAKVEMLELEGKLSETQAEIDEIANKVNQMTPRPQWGQLSGKTTTWRATTAEQVSAICRENALLSDQLSCLELEWTAAQVALSELTLKLGPVDAEKPEKKKDKKGGKKDKKKKK
ncbi:hypothetical protein SELMODRAFT_412597 [Selaginella moellendorffii]|uniref:Uncharacterized protein n=2 Tax=Selaginella moellendorffii TaxID=88036 RepID=D8RM03_SELML|nr:hypothetical protein SELMODRAFT_412597 [Selaginella moellendorffii]